MINYMPVSLLMFFSKIFMKSMHSRLSQHLHTNNILLTEQYSFRKVMSTEHAAFRLTVYSNLLTTKCTMEEFSVIWQRLLIA